MSWDTFTRAHSEFMRQIDHDFMPYQQCKARYAAECYPLQRTCELRHSQYPMLLLKFLEEWKNPAMARGRKNSNFNMPEMINYSLNSEQKAGFVKWMEKQVDTWHEELGELIADGWRMGISFDENNATYIVSATQRGEAHLFAGYCVTSRHAEYQVGLQIAVFKLNVVFKGKKPDELSATNDWG